jgi:hypothetical protein
MIPTTTERVSAHTAEHVNEDIRREAEERVESVVRGGPSTIDARLTELDAEWDIERTLEANAASVSLVGLALGAFVNRRWFVLPAVVAGFLLQHAVQGWCPPISVLRRLGIRTETEINQERYALKALRGDFEGVDAAVTGSSVKARQAFEAARV